jgi:hypothetical protein
MMSDLRDLVVDSDHVETNEGLAYHMLRPLHVIEISVLDVISQTTRGVPIQSMGLDFSSTNSTNDHEGIGSDIGADWCYSWKRIRKLPLVALIAPQFIRRRDDKDVNAADLRLDQITALVEIPLADVDVHKFELPKSEVLRREVYTKQLKKGQTRVRKLVLWQTNKGQGNGESGVGNRDFPAFVIHYTDFSPNRAAPLERDIRVSNSREWNCLELSRQTCRSSPDAHGAG